VRPVREPIPLFRTGPVEPIWAQRVTGPEQCLAANHDRLCLTNFKDTPAYVLLDYPASGQGFLWDIRIRPAPGLDPGVFESGIFFGYRRNPADPERRYPLFALKVVERREEDGGSQLLIGSAFVSEARGLLQELHQPFTPFAGKLGTVPLRPLPRTANGWRRVQVRVFRDQLSVAVDDGSFVPLDLARIRELRKPRDGSDLSPHGGMGIWAKRGVCFFRDASVTAQALEPGADH
jgi:hypothetical protein